MNRVELEGIAQRENERLEAYRCRLYCCASTPCLSSGGSAVAEALRQAVAASGQAADIVFTDTG